MKTAISGLCFVLLILGVTGPAAAAKEDAFPNRKLFPELAYISIEDFHKNYEKYIVVDVRSPFEYHTLHALNAINIHRTSKDFVRRMKELRANNRGKTIVLYCNGKKCQQSYKAGRKCYQNGIANVRVYDQGINDWARMYPELAVLLGKTPVDRSKLLGKEAIRQHMVPFDDFVRLANSANTLIIDVRDAIDREGVGLFMGREKRADYRHVKRLDDLLDEAARARQTVLMYDNAGTEVGWMMYHLKEKRIKHFYFLEGGMRQYYAKLLSDL